MNTLSDKNGSNKPRRSRYYVECWCIIV